MLIFMSLSSKFRINLSLSPALGLACRAVYLYCSLKLRPNAIGRPGRARQHPCKSRQCLVMGIDAFRSHRDAFCMAQLGTLRYC